jgi:uncharacterized membrane protein
MSCVGSRPSGTAIHLVTYTGVVKLARVLFVLLFALIPAMVQAQSGGSFGGGGFQNNGGNNSGQSGGGSSNPTPSQSPNSGYGYGYGPAIFSNGNSSTTILVLVIGAIIIGYFFISMRPRFGKNTLLETSAGGAGALKVQLMLLEGEEVKAELRRIAEAGDTSTPQGLSNMLREAVLSALRHPERWVYANVEQARGSDSASAQRVSSWATAARAAYKVETTSNHGKLQHADYAAPKGGIYCVLTLTAAARDFLLPVITPPVELEEVRAALNALAGVNGDALISAEVVWTPDATGEFLSEDQALRLYPTLYHL